MKHRNAAWLSLATVGVAALYLRERQREQRIDLLRDQLQETAESLRALRAQPRRNPVPGPAIFRLPAPTAAVASKDPPTAEDPATPPKTEPPPPKAATFEDRRDELDAAFQSENVDLEWASKVRAVAQDRLRAALPPSSSVQSVDCRKSMCRIETRHSNTDAYREFVRRAFQDDATRLWGGGYLTAIRVENPDKSLSTVSFLARDGQALPEW